MARVFGREKELAALHEFLETDSFVRALVLMGGPGMGKTTVWEAGIALARERGWRVLSAWSSGAEVRPTFAALIDLLDGVATDAMKLPAPQRAALEAALLRAEPAGAPPQPQAIGLGLLNALRALAAQERVMVALDDVQSLDPPSADALTFAARRVEGFPLRFLLSRRSGGRTVLERALARHDVMRLEIGPLSVGATRRLLSERLGLRLSRELLRRIAASTLGNPLFALEIGRALVERGTPEPGEDFPLPDPFGFMLVPAPMRRLLLAVALSGELPAGELAALAEPDVVQDAIDSGLLRSERDRVRASHPLLAAAARKRSRARERRALHLELAGVVADRELRARHLALAADGPDEAVAATVASASASASARGARQDAVTLAEHALRLSPPETPERVERLLALAEQLELAGESQRITDLLTPELPSLPAGAPTARAWLLLAEGAHVQTLHAFRQHLERALAESENDPLLHAYVLASTSSAVIGVERIREAEAQAVRALEIARADPGVERAVLFALAWARGLRGMPIDDVCARFQEASGAPAHMSHSPDRVAGQRLVWRGELDEARALFTRSLALADERGEAGSYAFHRLHLCELALRAGAWEEAARLLDEWAESAEREFLLPPMYERCRALLAAGRGLGEEADRWADDAIARAEEIGVQWDWLEALRVRGIAALLAHEPAHAAESLRIVWAHTQREGVEEPGAFPAAPDLVEALTELGDLGEARAVSDRLHELAERQRHPWGRATAKRCDALVRIAGDAYDEPAAHDLAGAAAAYDALGLRYDGARTRLSLGRAQRRNRKWGAARRSLEQAATTFDGLESPGWAQEARHELSRVGARRPAPSGELTPSERRVVELAIEGRANKEIARALHITVHTVEAHLKHVYEKLGVHSRMQLAHRLSAPKDHRSP